MNIEINDTVIHLIDDPTYSQGSVDNVRTYDKELYRENIYVPAACHGVFAGDVESPNASVILLGVGGATGIHSECVTHNGELCFIAAGDSIFALNVPSLELEWCRQVDSATCFGAYWLEGEKCLITWGELEIKRYNVNGKQEWSFSGADIFTEGFEFDNEHIVITDFNNKKYIIMVKLGNEI